MKRTPDGPPRGNFTTRLFKRHDVRPNGEQATNPINFLIYRTRT